MRPAPLRRYSGIEYRCIVPYTKLFSSPLVSIKYCFCGASQDSNSGEGNRGVDGRGINELASGSKSLAF